MALRDLRDTQLKRLMEDLWQEAARSELTTSPIGPPLEDEEVTLQGEGMGIQ